MTHSLYDMFGTVSSTFQWYHIQYFKIFRGGVIMMLTLRINRSTEKLSNSTTVKKLEGGVGFKPESLTLHWTPAYSASSGEGAHQPVSVTELPILTH